jgi:ribosomal protein S18 acetylase RimI-like enzyme
MVKLYGLRGFIFCRRSEMSMKKQAHIVQYQELSSNAWPARENIFLNGWVVRVSEGVTKRANSVLPVRYTGQNLLEDVRIVEKIYREEDLPVIFQLPDYFEPSNLQETLLSLGYRSTDETLVMTANIENIYTDKNNECTYSIEATGSDHWFHALLHFSDRFRTAEGIGSIIGRISLPRAFCYAWKNNKVLGIGLGVMEGRYLGIFDLIVHPEYRRKRIGQSLIGEMVEWSKSNSVSNIYLQVEGNNSRAISFYEKIGLKECYRYRYLTATPSSDAETKK